MLKPLEIGKLSGAPRLRVWLIALSSGPLIALSQPPVDVPFLALVGLAPLLLALPRLSAGGAWVAGFLVALCYFGGDMWWLGQMVTDPGNEWIVFGTYVFVACFMSAFWATAVMASRWLLTRSARWAVALVPLVWLGIEFTHEFNTPGPYPWIPLGSAITEMTLFIQTADIWGQYGLTFSILLVNLAFARSLELKGERATPGIRKEGAGRVSMPLAAIVVLLAGSIYGFVRMRQIDDEEVKDGPLIAVVQGNLAQEVKVRGAGLSRQESHARHVEMSAEAARNQAELICWAETMLFGRATRDGLNPDDPVTSASLFKDGVPSPGILRGTQYGPTGRKYSPAFVEHLRAKVGREFKTPMLVGVIGQIPPDEQDEGWKQGSYARRAYNTAMLIDKQGRISDTYDKRYLVPGGEYIPLEGFGPVRAIVEHYAESLQGRASRIEPGRRLTNFRLPSTATRTAGRDWAFTSSICYEYAFPGCYRELHEDAQQYPDFHVNISNEGWFKASAELDQAVDYCRLRCIESRVPMVRATNTGISCSIDAAGRVREVLTIDAKDREVQGLMYVRPALLRNPQPTLFVSVFGRGLAHLAMWATAGIMALMLAGRLVERRRRKQAKPPAEEPQAQPA